MTGVISTLVFAELLVPAYRANDVERAETLLLLLTTFPNLQVAPLSAQISAEAARLRAIHGMRTPDAIHVATALQMGVSGIVTNNKAFLRLAGLLDIWLFEPDR